ncbi:hypothetical protein CDD83_5232 [Cordyceps sp. RAO-2017]|nr:hypothetical protein CDD83_5232 [Cordyceps sp. RAO-2017]
MSSPATREPSAEETVQHPAYAGAVWALEPDRSGVLSVGAGRRGGPVRIAWEIHGAGPVKVMLLMGVGFTMAGWQRQTLRLGHDRRARFSVLLLDGRGIGGSDKVTWRPWATSDLARDAAELLDHVGWTGGRAVHVVGISLGGMVAQELACLAPERLASLSLVATCACYRDSGALSPSVFAARLRRAFHGGGDAVPDIVRAMCPPDFLAGPDEVVLPDPAATPRCRPPPGGASSDDGAGGGYRRFRSNFQRLQAEVLTMRRDGVSFSSAGYLGQIVAVLRHRKSRDQLRVMADAVGRRRILVVHGTRDSLIPVHNGEALIDVLEPAVGVIVEGLGHAPLIERTQWFNELLEEHFEASAKLDDDSSTPSAAPRL